MFPISTKALIIKVNEIKCTRVTQTTAPTAPTTPLGDSGTDIKKIFLEDCINCAPAVYGDANLETDQPLTPLGPGKEFTFGDLSAELGITFDLTEPVVTTAAPTVPTAEPTPTVPTAAPTMPTADQPVTMLVIVNNDEFRGRSVLALFREITKFDEAACAPTTPTRSSVVESEVFRGESVGTLLEDIKKFDETACSTGVTTGTGTGGTTGTGTGGTTGTGTGGTTGTGTGGTTGTGTGVTTGTGTGATGAPEVTDEMINEFIVNKKCV